MNQNTPQERVSGEQVTRPERSYAGRNYFLLGSLAMPYQVSVSSSAVEPETSIAAPQLRYTNGPGAILWHLDLSGRG
jgi:hypothetical protein